MRTFQKWVAESEAVDRISKAARTNIPPEDFQSLLSKFLYEAYKVGADMMLESCMILEDNAEKNRAKDRYITNRIRSL